MKKIVLEIAPKDLIEVDSLMGNETVAYRCANSLNYAILAKLDVYDGSSSYGFVPFGMSDSSPRYVASSWEEAVKKAMACRTVYVFNSPSELLSAMKEHRF